MTRVRLNAQGRPLAPEQEQHARHTANANHSSGNYPVPSPASRPNSTATTTLSSHHHTTATTTTSGGSGNVSQATTSQQSKNPDSGETHMRKRKSPPSLPAEGTTHPTTRPNVPLSTSEHDELALFRLSGPSRLSSSSATTTTTTTTSSSFPSSGPSSSSSSSSRLSSSSHPPHDSVGTTRSQSGKGKAKLKGEDQERQNVAEDMALAKYLKEKHGFVIHEMEGDGNCFFRAIAHQVYGDAEMYDMMRQKVMDYLDKERSYFSQFITEDIQEFIARKRKDRVFANNVEMQAVAEMFNRPIEVYERDKEVNIFNDVYSSDIPPLRLSYHQGNHYNSVIDPNNPAVGVGLGWAEFEPGLADKLQMKRAFQESEMESLDWGVMEKQTHHSDREETERQLEQAVLEASRKEYWESLMKQHTTPD
eukprot:TRINITY_DN269_c0_g2_i1.p1 TRINITY_DN269_c0_g2~~TRINITY_DN269_c0_g2_i1.p1  ORF type:complete len:420 (+),score=96.91 TRINITY_DN269_c0_g2_i1:238-1497(+)